MKTFFQKTLVATLSGIVLAIAGCGGDGSDDISSDIPAPTITVPPLDLPGPYAVACSNIAQDFSRVPAGEIAEDYWEGSPTQNGTPRYVTDLLADPANSLSVTVKAPNDETLYGSFAGKQVQSLVFTCYPTAANNPQPDFLLPTDTPVPHMQTGSAPPLFANTTTRYPMIMFSHGYSGSPISSTYLKVMSIFASFGYVVVAPFHGDPRISNLKIDKISDAVAVLADFKNFTALQALRPLTMSAAIDLMLAHPHWRDHINASQIGGFGTSMGGETLMLMGGAGLTTSVGLSWSQVTVDRRLKAAVGYVPYFGEPFLPAFGRDQRGIEGVTLPYLAISGTKDTTAPIATTELGIKRLTGTRELIALAGVTHGFDVPSTNDIFTWSLTFFDAEVRDNPAARQQLSTMANVAGGGNDSVVIRYEHLGLH